IFVGSVGSLDEHIGIGDVVIPQWSISGDGASRYISKPALKNADVFGEKVFPNQALYNLVWKNTKNICEANHVAVHAGKTFCVDTIFAQFAHIDEMINMGCNVIEMETAAAFRAAALANIKIAAVFSVSDNTVAKKSLVSGRTETDLESRKFTRKTIFPQIILGTLRQMRSE
ncbi:MAG: phosphorylase, partial [Eubacteriales bacterium]|nr:phosphorylase [Eubacteriales bacterium]